MDNIQKLSDDVLYTVVNGQNVALTDLSDSALEIELAKAFDHILAKRIGTVAYEIKRRKAIIDAIALLWDVSIPT